MLSQTFRTTETQSSFAAFPVSAILNNALAANTPGDGHF
jgi:hypothetical protein